ncbi:hypothetical protein O181_013634 [Austropuccinia psidii MF-1]|uniref:Zinc finger PHD-type domain-containing protein n=1 Tax=Austropuccinia psidii MF-1 TaxID=1389203 RepID=A0A9Q3GP22_9BASI|nr:hypothetical protein [Austropuccinia psidii MF-1]
MFTKNTSFGETLRPIPTPTRTVNSYNSNSSIDSSPTFSLDSHHLYHSVPHRASIHSHHHRHSPAHHLHLRPCIPPSTDPPPYSHPSSLPSEHPQQSSSSQPHPHQNHYQPTQLRQSLHSPYPNQFQPPFHLSLNRSPTREPTKITGLKRKHSRSQSPTPQLSNFNPSTTFSPTDSKPHRSSLVLSDFHDSKQLNSTSKSFKVPFDLVDHHDHIDQNQSHQPSMPTHQSITNQTSRSHGTLIPHSLAGLLSSDTINRRPSMPEDHHPTLNGSHSTSTEQSRSTNDHHLSWARPRITQAPSSSTQAHIMFCHSSNSIPPSNLRPPSAQEWSSFPNTSPAPSPLVSSTVASSSTDYPVSQIHTAVVKTSTPLPTATFPHGYRPERSSNHHHHHHHHVTEIEHQHSPLSSSHRNLHSLGPPLNLPYSSHSHPPFPSQHSHHHEAFYPSPRRTDGRQEIYICNNPPQPHDVQPTTFLHDRLRHSSNRPNQDHQLHCHPSYRSSDPQRSHQFLNDDVASLHSTALPSSSLSDNPQARMLHSANSQHSIRTSSMSCQSRKQSPLVSPLDQPRLHHPEPIRIPLPTSGSHSSSSCQSNELYPTKSNFDRHPHNPTSFSHPPIHSVSQHSTSIPPASLTHDDTVSSPPCRPCHYVDSHPSPLVSQNHGSLSNGIDVHESFQLHQRSRPHSLCASESPRLQYRSYPNGLQRMSPRFSEDSLPSPADQRQLPDLNGVFSSESREKIHHHHSDHSAKRLPERSNQSRLSEGSGPIRLSPQLILQSPASSNVSLGEHSRKHHPPQQSHQDIIPSDCLTRPTSPSEQFTTQFIRQNSTSNSEPTLATFPLKSHDSIFSQRHKNSNRYQQTLPTQHLITQEDFGRRRSSGASELSAHLIQRTTEESKECTILNQIALHPVPKLETWRNRPSHISGLLSNHSKALPSSPSTPSNEQKRSMKALHSSPRSTSSLSLNNPKHVDCSPIKTESVSLLGPNPIPLNVNFPQEHAKSRPFASTSRATTPFNASDNVNDGTNTSKTEKPTVVTAIESVALNRNHGSPQDLSLLEDEAVDEFTDDGIIRCICSITTDDGFTIQCETCEVWQHAVCVKVPIDEVPEHYFCDKCDPSPMRRKRLREMAPQAERIQQQRLKREAHGHFQDQLMDHDFHPTLSEGSSGSRKHIRTEDLDDNLLGSPGASVVMSRVSSGTCVNESTTIEGMHQSPTMANYKAQHTPFSDNGLGLSGLQESSIVAGVGSHGVDGNLINRSAFVRKTGRKYSKSSQHKQAFSKQSFEQFAPSNTGGSAQEPDGSALGLHTQSAIETPDDRYEAWRYEYTPTSKDLYVDPGVKHLVQQLTSHYMRFRTFNDAETKIGSENEQLSSDFICVFEKPTPSSPKVDVSMLDSVKSPSLTLHPLTSPQVNVNESIVKAPTSTPYTFGKALFLPVMMTEIPPPIKLFIKPILPSAINFVPTLNTNPFCPTFTNPLTNSTTSSLPRLITHGVFSAESISRGSYIASLKGTITSFKNYTRDVFNQYDILGCNKPYVKFFKSTRLTTSPMDDNQLGAISDGLVIDSRQYGNELRFIRNGCHPNAFINIIISPHSSRRFSNVDCPRDHDLSANENSRVKNPLSLYDSEFAEKTKDIKGLKSRLTRIDAIMDKDLHLPWDVSFGVFAASDISRREEIILPWDWDDQHMVHLLPRLLNHSHIFETQHQHRSPSLPPIQMRFLPWSTDDLKLLCCKMASITLALFGLTFCGCEKKRSCAINLMWKIGCLSAGKPMFPITQHSPKFNDITHELMSLFNLKERQEMNLPLSFESRFRIVLNSFLEQPNHNGSRNARATSSNVNSTNVRRSQKLKIDLGPLLGLRRDWWSYSEKQNSRVEALISNTVVVTNKNLKRTRSPSSLSTNTVTHKVPRVNHIGDLTSPTCENHDHDGKQDQEADGGMNLPIDSLPHHSLKTSQQIADHSQQTTGILVTNNQKLISPIPSLRPTSPFSKEVSDLDKHPQGSSVSNVVIQPLFKVKSLISPTQIGSHLSVNSESTDSNNLILSNSFQETKAMLKVVDQHVPTPLEMIEGSIEHQENKELSLGHKELKEANQNTEHKVSVHVETQTPMEVESEKVESALEDLVTADIETAKHAEGPRCKQVNKSGQVLPLQDYLEDRPHTTQSIVSIPNSFQEQKKIEESQTCDVEVPIPTSQHQHSHPDIVSSVSQEMLGIAEVEPNAVRDLNESHERHDARHKESTARSADSFNPHIRLSSFISQVDELESSLDLKEVTLNTGHDGVMNTTEKISKDQLLNQVSVLVKHDSLETMDANAIRIKSSNINKLLDSIACLPRPMESIGSTDVKHLKVTESPCPDILDSEQQSFITLAEASQQVDIVESMTPNTELPSIIDLKRVDQLPQVSCLSEEEDLKPFAVRPSIDLENEPHLGLCMVEAPSNHVIEPTDVPTDDNIGRISGSDGAVPDESILSERSDDLSEEFLDSDASTTILNSSDEEMLSSHAPRYLNNRKRNKAKTKISRSDTFSRNQKSMSPTAELNDSIIRPSNKVQIQTNINTDDLALDQPKQTLKSESKKNLSSDLDTVEEDIYMISTKLSTGREIGAKPRRTIRSSSTSDNREESELVDSKQQHRLRISPTPPLSSSSCPTVNPVAPFPMSSIMKPMAVETVKAFNLPFIPMIKDGVVSESSDHSAFILGMKSIPFQNPIVDTADSTRRKNDKQDEYKTTEPSFNVQKTDLPPQNTLHPISVMPKGNMNPPSIQAPAEITTSKTSSNNDITNHHTEIVRNAAIPKAPPKRISLKDYRSRKGNEPVIASPVVNLSVGLPQAQRNSLYPDLPRKQPPPATTVPILPPSLPTVPQTQPLLPLSPRKLELVASVLKKEDRVSLKGGEKIKQDETTAVLSPLPLSSLQQKEDLRFPILVSQSPQQLPSKPLNHSSALAQDSLPYHVGSDQPNNIELNHPTSEMPHQSSERQLEEDSCNKLSVSQVPLSSSSIPDQEVKAFEVEKSDDNQSVISYEDDIDGVAIESMSTPVEGDFEDEMGDEERHKSDVDIFTSPQNSHSNHVKLGLSSSQVTIGNQTGLISGKPSQVDIEMAAPIDESTDQMKVDEIQNVTSGDTVENMTPIDKVFQPLESAKTLNLECSNSLQSKDSTELIQSTVNLNGVKSPDHELAKPDVVGRDLCAKDVKDSVPSNALALHPPRPRPRLSLAAYRKRLAATRPSVSEGPKSESTASPDPLNIGLSSASDSNPSQSAQIVTVNSRSEEHPNESLVSTNPDIGMIEKADHLRSSSKDFMPSPMVLVKKVEAEKTTISNIAITEQSNSVTNLDPIVAGSSCPNGTSIYFPPISPSILIGQESPRSPDLISSPSPDAEIIPLQSGAPQILSPSPQTSSRSRTPLEPYPTSFLDQTITEINGSTIVLTPSPVQKGSNASLVTDLVDGALTHETLTKSNELTKLSQSFRTRFENSPNKSFEQTDNFRTIQSSSNPSSTSALCHNSPISSAALSSRLAIYSNRPTPTKAIGTISLGSPSDGFSAEQPSFIRVESSQPASRKDRSAPLSSARIASSSTNSRSPSISASPKLHQSDLSPNSPILAGSSELRQSPHTPTNFPIGLGRPSVAPPRAPRALQNVISPSSLRASWPPAPVPSPNSVSPKYPTGNPTGIQNHSSDGASRLTQEINSNQSTTAPNPIESSRTSNYPLPSHRLPGFHTSSGYIIDNRPALSPNIGISGPGPPSGPRQPPRFNGSERTRFEGFSQAPIANNSSTNQARGRAKVRGSGQYCSLKGAGSGRGTGGQRNDRINVYFYSRMLHIICFIRFSSSQLFFPLEGWFKSIA